MSLRFAVRLALREGRSGVRRVGWFMGAIALGVAALVAVYSFQRDAAASVRAEARDLLGGDLRLQSSSPLPERVETVLDSLTATGAVVARATSLASVVSVPGTSRARVLQVNAVGPNFPAIGEVDETPDGVWVALRQGGGAVADQQVFQQLLVEVGDAVRAGTLPLRMMGSVSGLPVDFGIEWVAGPPLYIALSDLPATGLVDFGSLAQYRAWIALMESDAAAQLRELYVDEFRALGVSIDTAQREAEGFASGFENLMRFLGLVGLLALLLGGIGVGSAVNVYLRERQVSIAVLRCLGAERLTVIWAYLLQALALGIAGAGIGVTAGISIQFLLPALFGGMLPFTVVPRLHPSAVLAGWTIGAWVSVLFSLLPLLRASAVSPMAALRSEVEPSGSSGRATALTIGLVLMATLYCLALFQLGEADAAAGVTLGTAGALVVLGGVAIALGRLVRALLPTDAPFWLRQGLSGLFRPGNQTGAVVVGLGAGAFVMSGLLVIESGLREDLAMELGADRPTLLLFDIQRDQLEGVRDLLLAEGIDDELIPIVPARLRSVAGSSVEEILSRGVRRRWMYGRLYRNTYRLGRSPDETVTVGRWWDDPGEDPPVVRNAVERGIPRISLEDDLAEDLGVEIGDSLVWDVQGVPVRSVISSLRSVEWSSLQPNFFVVFEPGSLDEAPATFVALSSTPDSGSRQRIQTALLDGFPNVSFLDIARVQETLERLAGRVSWAFRALAAFILGGGILVLFASLLTTRFKRRQESALLKTLGASGRVVRRVLLAEYTALGGIGGAAGLLLGGLGGSLFLQWQFEVSSDVPWGALLALWVGILALSALVGWSVSGPVIRASPLETLRGEGR